MRAGNFLSGLIAFALSMAASAPALSEPRPSGSGMGLPPRPAPVADARDSGLLRSCGVGDAALHEVSARLAQGEVLASDAEALTYALRMSGIAHVRPRAWTLSGIGVSRAFADARLRAWLSTFGDVGERRCGIASAQSDDGRDIFAAVVIDAQADLLTMLPTRVRSGDWVKLDARTSIPATGAKVVVLGPSGAPKTVLTSFSGGRIRATFRADRPGAFLAQVLIEGDAGPRPVLEALIFADMEPPPSPPQLEAPGEQVDGQGLDAEEALARMVAAARKSERLAPLARDPALDDLARAHAAAMRGARRAAHDVGDGPPHERLEAGGITARAIGENVAHAASVALAHRALWASPSHRGNLLDPRFTRIGIATLPAEDGTIWVTQLFASD